MKTFPALIILMLGLSLFTSCEKGNDGEQEFIDNFSATVDDTALNFTEVVARYLPEYNQLILEAVDESESRVGFFIYLPKPDPVGVVQFAPNGTNTAYYLNYDSSFYYFTDDNNPLTTGSFTITAFDSISRKLSGNYFFKAYNRMTNKFSEIEGSVINIDMDILHGPNKLNYMECDVSTGNSWFSDIVGASIVAKSDTDSTLEVGAYVKEGDRQLQFQIPVTKGTGTFPLKIKSSSSLMTDHRAEYRFYNYVHNAAYSVVPGVSTITITSLNTTTREITATFNLQVKNEVNDVITFTNGEFMAQWNPLF